MTSERPAERSRDPERPIERSRDLERPIERSRDPERPAERSRDLERLLTFVDAIAAVAITLLILPLVDLAGQLGDGASAGRLVAAHTGQLWSFVLSFLVIARLWLAQHRILRPVIAASRGIVACLVLWALAIVFLPFPTALLPSAGEQPLTKVLYIGTLALSAGLLAVLALVARRDPAVLEPGDAPSGASAASTAVLLALALAVSLTVPATGYYPMVLLTLSDNLPPLARRLTGRRTGSPR